MSEEDFVKRGAELGRMLAARRAASGQYTPAERILRELYPEGIPTTTEGFGVLRLINALLHATRGGEVGAWEALALEAFTLALEVHTERGEGGRNTPEPV